MFSEENTVLINKLENYKRKIKVGIIDFGLEIENIEVGGSRKTFAEVAKLLENGTEKHSLLKNEKGKSVFIRGIPARPFLNNGVSKGLENKKSYVKLISIPNNKSLASNLRRLGDYLVYSILEVMSSYDGDDRQSKAYQKIFKNGSTKVLERTGALKRHIRAKIEWE